MKKPARQFVRIFADKPEPDQRATRKLEGRVVARVVPVDAVLLIALGCRPHHYFQVAAHISYRLSIPSMMVSD